MVFFRIALAMIFALSLLGPSPSHATTTADRAYQRAKRDYRRLIHSPRKKRYRDNWIRVIDRFQNVAKSFPRSPRAPDALYMAGRACQGLFRVSRVKKDARRAVALYDSLATAYPHNSLADDSLVLGGRLEEDVLGDLPGAYRRYEEVVKRYPDGDMITLARHKAASLLRYAPPSPSGFKGAQAKSAPVSPSGPVQVTGIRYRSLHGGTRVVIDLNKKAEYTADYLNGDTKHRTPPRLYVDVKHATEAASIRESMKVDDGCLLQIRTGRPDPNTVRVVLDLSGPHKYKVVRLLDPFRIEIDVTDGPSSQLTSDGPEMRSIPPGPKDGIADVLQKASSESSRKVKLPAIGGEKRLRRIVVDAGHGGKDPGAIGPDGVREKDVALRVAKDLARLLRKELGCEVILTRHTDTFLPLQERTAIANKLKADMFISIHANACPNPHTHGIETYYLNFSKNDEATAVVARENDTSLKQVGDLERILFDLMANSKINESSRLAAEIQNSLVRDMSRHYSRIKDLGVRQGPFYVLLGATMPSVLVETDFISNKREESRLANPRYDENIAVGIADGVRKYAEALNLIATK